MIFVVFARVEGPSERRLDFFFFGLLGKILWAVLAASDAALCNPETNETAGPSIKSECVRRPTLQSQSIEVGTCGCSTVPMLLLTRTPLRQQAHTKPIPTRGGARAAQTGGNGQTPVWMVANHHRERNGYQSAGDLNLQR